MRKAPRPLSTPQDARNPENRMKKRKRGPAKEVLYGVHPVAEAISAARREISGIYFSEQRVSRRIEAVASLAASRQIPVRRIPPERLDAMAGAVTHQGVCAEVGPYPWATLDDILAVPAAAGGEPFILLLDQVVDPRNLGAAARTALSLGLDGIFLTRDRSAVPTAAASKASAGAVEHARIARVTNMTAAVKKLKAAGIWVFGLDAGADTPIFAADLGGPLALVIGGEERGIRPLVKKQCDALVAIPRRGPVLSMNAAAAGAVAMYEAFRQRQTGRGGGAGR